MASDDEGSTWGRTVLVGLGALLAVSLLVGGVVGVMALGAAKLSGIGETGTATTARPSLVIPTGKPTTRPQQYPNPPGSSKSPSAEPSSPEPSPTKKPRPLTLEVTPARAAAGERVDLSGVYPRGEGATLQVQRLEGSWTDFPVTAPVSGGIFHTYIYTERTGQSRWRVLDPATGQASNAVRLTIG